MDLEHYQGTTFHADTINLVAEGVMLRIHACGATNTGPVRKTNQDRYIIQLPMIAIADGMGGMPGGDIAASIAIDELAHSVPTRAIDLAAAVRRANVKVFQRASADPRLQGMGTTLTAAWLGIEHDQTVLMIAHVGDSRAYMFQERSVFQQVTKDHSLIEDLIKKGVVQRENRNAHPMRNILTRSIGAELNVQVDTARISIYANSTVLLCTDGITNYLEEHHLAELVKRSADVKTLALRCVTEAIEHGSDDNVTAVALSIMPKFDEKKTVYRDGRPN